MLNVHKLTTDNKAYASILKYFFSLKAILGTLWWASAK